jgi:hypothetical protein
MRLLDRLWCRDERLINAVLGRDIWLVKAWWLSDYHSDWQDRLLGWR